MTVAAAGCVGLLVVAAMVRPGPALGQPSDGDRSGVQASTLARDAIDEPLTAVPGDAQRGRRIVADRRVGLCLLCHPAPIPEERFQGDLAPDLAGVGKRLTEGQLRLQIVDSRRILPGSIMPAFHRVTGLQRVAREREGQPVLDAQQVEDVVAWLRTLR